KLYRTCREEIAFKEPNSLQADGKDGEGSVLLEKREQRFYVKTGGNERELREFLRKPANKRSVGAEEHAETIRLISPVISIVNETPCGFEQLSNLARRKPPSFVLGEALF